MANNNRNALFEKLTGTKPCPKIMITMKELLEAEGHSCATIVGSLDFDLVWCKKDECPSATAEDKRRLQQKKMMEYVRKLAQEGHTCVEISESRPATLRWCGQATCADKK